MAIRPRVVARLQWEERAFPSLGLDPLELRSHNRDRLLGIERGRGVALRHELRIAVARSGRCVVAATCRAAPVRVYSRRMPRMQVYLPDDLYRAVKDRELPASDLLQKAVRAELRREELLEEADRYLADLIASVGKPTAAALAKAEALSRRIQRRGSGTRAP